MYVVDFLAAIFFYDYLVRQSGRPYRLDAFHYIVAGVQLPSFEVEVVGGHAYDEIISEGFGPFQKIDVTLMEQIESAICDYFGHGLQS